MVESHFLDANLDNWIPVWTIADSRDPMAASKHGKRWHGKEALIDGDVHVSNVVVPGVVGLFAVVLVAANVAVVVVSSLVVVVVAVVVVVVENCNGMKMSAVADSIDTDAIVDGVEVADGVDVVVLIVGSHTVAFDVV